MPGRLVPFGTSVFLIGLATDGWAQDVPQPSIGGSAVASAAHPPVPRAAAAEREERLDSTLAKLSEENSFSAGAAILDGLTGAAWVGLGAYFAFGSHDQVGDGVSRVVGVTGSLIWGVPLLVSSIRIAGGVTSTDEERYARFRRERGAGSLSAERLAHYEGELEAEAAIARHQRVTSGFLGVASVASGGALIAYGASSQLADARTGRMLAYAEGAAFAAFGTWLAVASFAGESENEREWRLYQARDSRRSAHLRLVPVLTPRGAMVGAAGEF